MKWGSFFNLRKLKIGGSVAAVTAAAGATTTYAYASQAQSFCSEIVNSFIHQMIQNVTIPELSTIVHYKDYNATVTLEDTTVIVPQSWVNMVNETPGVDPLCYQAVFIFGMCMTACFSLALAAFVNGIIRDQSPSPVIIELESTSVNDATREGEDENDSLLIQPPM